MLRDRTNSKPADSPETSGIPKHALKVAAGSEGKIKGPEKAKAGNSTKPIDTVRSLSKLPTPRTAARLAAARPGSGVSCPSSAGSVATGGDSGGDVEDLLTGLLDSPTREPEWLEAISSPASADLRAAAVRVSPAASEMSVASAVDLGAALRSCAAAPPATPVTPGTAWFGGAAVAQSPPMFQDDTLLGMGSGGGGAAFGHGLCSPAAGLLESPCAPHGDFSFSAAGASACPPATPTLPAAAEDPFAAFRTFLAGGHATYATPLPAGAAPVPPQASPPLDLDAAPRLAPTAATPTFGAMAPASPFSFRRAAGGASPPGTPRFGTFAFASAAAQPLALTPAQASPGGGSPFSRARSALQQRARGLTSVSEARACIERMAAPSSCSTPDPPDLDAPTDAAATPPYKKLMRHLNPGQEALAAASRVETPLACKARAPPAEVPEPAEDAATLRMPPKAPNRRPTFGPASPESPAQFQALLRNIQASRYASPAVLHPPGADDAATEPGGGTPDGASFSGLLRNIRAAQYASPALPHHLVAAGVGGSPAAASDDSPAASACESREASSQHTPPPTLTCPLSDAAPFSSSRAAAESSGSALHSLHFASGTATEGTEASPLSGLCRRSVVTRFHAASPASCAGDDSPAAASRTSEAGHATSPPLIGGGARGALQRTQSVSDSCATPGGPAARFVGVHLEAVSVEGGAQLVQMRLTCGEGAAASASLSLAHSACSAAESVLQRAAPAAALDESDASDTVVMGDVTPRSLGGGSPCNDAVERSASFSFEAPQSCGDENADPEGSVAAVPCASPQDALSPQRSASPHVPEACPATPASSAAGRTPVAMHVDALTESLHTLHRLKASHAPLTPEFKDMIAQLDSVAQTAAASAAPASPGDVRSSISAWFRENDFERGELSGARLAALECLWTQAQEAAQLGQQVEHLKALDLETAGASQRAASALQQDNWQLARQCKALGEEAESLAAANAALQAELQSLRAQQSAAAAPPLPPASPDAPARKPRVSAAEVTRVDEDIQAALGALRARMEAVGRELDTPSDVASVVREVCGLCRRLKRKAVVTLGGEVHALFETMQAVLKFATEERAPLDELLASAPAARGAVARSAESPAAARRDAGFRSTAVTMSMRFHHSATYARLQEWHARLTEVTRTLPGEAPVAMEASASEVDACPSPVATLEAHKHFDRDSEAGALERILVHASAAQAAQGGALALRSSAAVDGAPQSLSVRLAAMAMQANEFLREYTAYAAPPRRQDQATVTTPGVARAARSPVHGDVSFSSLTPVDPDGASTPPPRHAVPIAAQDPFHQLFPLNPLFGVERETSQSQPDSAIPPHTRIGSPTCAASPAASAIDEPPPAAPSATSGAVAAERSGTKSSSRSYRSAERQGEAGRAVRSADGACSAAPSALHGPRGRSAAVASAGTRRAGAGSGTPDGQRLRFLCNALKQSVPSLVASPSSEGDAVFD